MDLLSMIAIIVAIVRKVMILTVVAETHASTLRYGVAYTKNLKKTLNK